MSSLREREFLATGTEPSGSYSGYYAGVSNIRD